MYTGNPATNPIDALRLRVGDTDEDDVWLTDNDYQYYLGTIPTFKQQVLASSQAILFKLARYTRERAGQIEVYGSDVYKNYADALVRLIKDPAFNGVYPMSYFGGIVKQDVYDNIENQDIIQTEFYTGQNQPKLDCCEEDNEPYNQVRLY